MNTEISINMLGIMYPPFQASCLESTRIKHGFYESQIRPNKAMRVFKINALTDHPIPQGLLQGKLAEL